MIEVLAALVMTMLLVMALTPFIGQMFATWTRGSEIAAMVELKSRGLGQLRADLRHAVVWTGFGQLDSLPAFRGNETSMSFPVVSGLGPRARGVEYLSFTVEASVDGRALVRRRAPITGRTYGAFSDPVVLFSGPYKYVFRYHHRGGEESPVWPTSWFDLPGDIELDIVDRSGRFLHVPIAIPAFASISAACFAASNLQGCPTLNPEDENEWLKAYRGEG